MKLTEAELAALPERIQQVYPMILSMSDSELKDLLHCFCEELAHALAPQPCGHPGAALARDGMCGWCRSQNKADDFRERLWNVVAERDALQRKWKEAVISSGVLATERDALRNRVQALEDELSEAHRQLSHEGVSG